MKAKHRELKYQDLAMEFFTTPKDQGDRILYLALGLCGEAGEVADKYKRCLRGEDITNLDIALELGDVLWNVAVLAHEMGYSLSEIGVMNINKLKSRRKRGTMLGSGDNR